MANGATPERIRLPGDASTRKYFRELKSGTVIMQFPNTETGAQNAMRFTATQQWLRGLSIPVPEILDVGPTGLIFTLTDLGDTTLYEALQQRPQTECETQFRALLDYLSTIQKASTRPKGYPFLPPLQDGVLVNELEFLQRNLWPEGAQSGDLEEFFHRITNACATDATVATHRDYHSRNIMIHDNRLFVIDFQDLRDAHPAYDIVSLLYDAYIEISAELRNDLLAALECDEGFYASALQRNLKAIGTFVAQNRKGNSFYLKFIPRCIQYCFDHLRKLNWTAEMNLIREIQTATECL